MQKAEVHTEYKSAYPKPIKLKRDAEVKIEEKECEWEGWLWCDDGKKTKGWVPEAFVVRNGDEGKMLSDYSAHELTVRKGDKLSVIEQICGWARCETADGEIGWVPLDNITLV